MIYSDNVFWIITMIIAFLETMGICYACEKKLKKIDERERRAEQRRKERSHDDYCTREVERLYNEGKYRTEGFTAK